MEKGCGGGGLEEMSKTHKCANLLKKKNNKTKQSLILDTIFISAQGAICVECSVFQANLMAE